MKKFFLTTASAVLFSISIFAQKQTIEKIDKSTIVYGSIKMFAPVGGSHVRQVIIQIPGLKFKDAPTVTVTIHNTTSGNVFGVWGITKDDTQTGLYQVKVSAANVVTGEKVDPKYDFYCDYIIVGETKN